MTNSNLTKTENNATTYMSSLSPVVDLFFDLPTLRNSAESDILELVCSAYERSPKKTLQVLLWTRAARIGAGERKTPLMVLERINKECPDFITNNCELLAELGYYKDLLRFMDNPSVVKYWATQIRAKDRLACKWAPRQGDDAKLLKAELGMTWKEWRTHLKVNSDTVEQKMSSKRFPDIAYSSVPGKAMRKYRAAFNRQDEERYKAFLEDTKSKASVSASYPIDVLKIMGYRGESYLYGVDPTPEELKLAEKQWANLPDFIKEGENILPVVDISGSMTWDENSPDGGKTLPIDVACSLGLYMAERNKGEFNNRVMTFSQSPQMVHLKGNLQERLSVMNSDKYRGYNTDFQATYEQLLSYATSFNVPADHMPTILMVFSDMQFDDPDLGNTDLTHLDDIRNRFKDAGYACPKLVFWNVAARLGQKPARHDDEGVALVGGYSPAIMEAILACEEFTPYEVMMEALSQFEVNFEAMPTTDSFK